MPEIGVFSQDSKTLQSMMLAPKERSKIVVESERETDEERSYYYNDAHGYEDYEPEDEEDEPDPDD